MTGRLASLSARALQTDLISGLAGKEPTIVELPQAKVTGLVASLSARALQTDLISGLAARALQTDLISGLAGKVDSSTFLEANTQRVTVDARLEASINEKADAAATTTALAGKVSTQQLNDAIATRQPVIQDGALTIARTEGLQALLDDKPRAIDVSNALKQ